MKPIKTKIIPNAQSIWSVVLSLRLNNFCKRHTIETNASIDNIPNTTLNVKAHTIHIIIQFFLQYVLS